MDCWGKLKWIDRSKGTIHAREIVSVIGRDMSYIKVSPRVSFNKCFVVFIFLMLETLILI